MPMERTASVEDMVGNLWRLGRTPSQAEFEQFFSNIAQVGSHQNLAAAAAQAGAATASAGAAAAGGGGAGGGMGGLAGGAAGEDGGAAAAASQAQAGIPRVASIDLLRKMIMHQPGMPPMGVPGAPGAPIPGMLPAMHAPGVGAFNPEAISAAAGAFGAFGAPVATMPIAPTAVHVGGLAAGMNGGSLVGGLPSAEGGAASHLASLAGAAHNPLAAVSPTAAAAAAAANEKPAKPSAKKPAAKKQKTGAEKAATPTPAEKKGAKGGAGGAAGGGGGTSENGKSDDGRSNYDSMDDLSDEEGDGKGGKTTDEVRRQRRMLSNRESARRSRRRKLEHVSTLEGQIAMHKAETAAVLERLQATEQRMESVLRENAGLKAEMERLQVQLRDVANGGKVVGAMERSSSLQRIASAGNLAKSTLGGGGDASPQIGGDDSPRGFVPFRSLQSYENLLSLQAQTR